MHYTVKASAIVLALALAACSNDNSEQNKTQEAAEETTEAAVDASTESAAIASAEFQQANVAFLEQNKAKEGVQVTETGLQYKILEEGTGPVPTADDYVSVHYAGRLIDGSEFDSSYGNDTPAIFPAGRLIKGWTEALTMMPVGSKWELTIPAELAYGKRGAGNGVIPADATLVFDVELLGIKTEEEAQAEMAAAREAMMAAMKEEQTIYLENNAKQDGVMTTDSGLQYRVITEGTGDKHPTETSEVTVHYAGKLIDGTEFDSSYKRNAPASFPLNGVIAGWTEGLQLMTEGAKYEFFIPYDLGYGERGSRSIPPFAALVFTVELISIDS